MQKVALVLGMCCLSVAQIQGVSSMLTNHGLLTKFFEWAAVTGKSYRSVDEFGFRLE